MRPTIHKKTNFQVLKEEAVAHFSNFPPTTIEKLLNFQWEITYKQFSKEDVSSVEITGFGTFKIRPKQTKEEIERRKAVIEFYEKELITDPTSERTIKKLEGIREELRLLESKELSYSNNLPKPKE